MKAIAGLGLMLALGGCAQSIDEVRAMPIRWTASYAVPFDTMANCLAVRATKLGTPIPQIYPRDGVARVAIAQSGVTDSILGEFTIRRATDTSSTVEWQHRGKVLEMANSSYDTWSREFADACGKS